MSGNETRWPAVLRPNFFIVHCINCAQHQYCTRHIQEKYTNTALDLQKRLIEMMGKEVTMEKQGIDENEERSQVSINIFHKDLSIPGQVYVGRDHADKDGKFVNYEPSSHMLGLAISLISHQETDYFNVIDQVPIGAFEVYFMGVRIYSKLQSLKWPNLTALVERCKRAFNDYKEGNDISQYETMLGLYREPNEQFQYYQTNASGKFNTGLSNSIDYSPGTNANFRDEEQKYQIVGRQVSLGECKYVFNRVWKATLDGCNEKHDEHGQGTDHLHQTDKRLENEILLSDLFHVIDLAGKLMNKKEPEDDDTKPYDEWQKYAQQMVVTDENGEKVHLEYVETKDVPKILLGIFVGQPDEKRISAEELNAKFDGQGEKKQICEHILDQVWIQYDADKEKGLDEHQCQEFVSMVLDIHEQQIAKKLGRQPKEVVDEKVAKVIDECEKNKDGRYTKEAVNKWVVKFLEDQKETKENEMEFLSMTLKGQLKFD